jgi:cell division septal protein FtsQ
MWQVGGVGYAVDEDGVVLDAAPDDALPVIVQTDGTPGLRPGDRVDGDAVRMALRVRELAPAAVGQLPVRFEWTQARGLEVMTDRGVRVRLGDEAGLEYKLAVWRAVLQQAGRTAVTEIDLRFGDRAFYR